MALNVNYPNTPNGKRTIKTNVYGNVNGYVGGKKFWEFGCGSVAEKIAIAWESGKTLEDAHLYW